jgi:hypothetical protein
VVGVPFELLRVNLGKETEQIDAQLAYILQDLNIQPKEQTNND